ncbi:MAG: DUF692 domain-containing protein [Nannocystales bacterium]
MFPVAVGLSFRPAWLDSLLALPGRGPIDVLEVMVDDALHCADTLKLFRRLGARWPLLGHGVALGIGNADGLDCGYLAAISEILAHLHVRWYGDHLCFLTAGDYELGHFAPVGADHDSLAALEVNGAEVRRTVTVPFLLENPADVLGWGAESPNAGARLGREFGACIEAADAGAILDVTNLLYGSRNDGFNAEAFIAAMPLERLVQVHLAGGRQIRGLWIDSHDRPIEPDSMALLEVVLRDSPNLRAVTLEWDEDLPEFEVALAAVDRVRSVVREAGR